MDVTLGTLASFPEPLAPLIAARRAGRRLDFETLVRQCESVAASHDLTLVEGSGGLLVPIDEKRDFADLALRLEAALAVVARPGLGTLNHTALTLEAAEGRGLEVSLLICSGTSPEPDVVERENLRFFAAMRGARQPRDPMPLLAIERAPEADAARPERLAVRIEGALPEWMPAEERSP